MPAASADYYDYEPDGIEFDAEERSLPLHPRGLGLRFPHGFVGIAFSRQARLGVYVTMLVYNAHVDGRLRSLRL